MFVRGDLILSCQGLNNVMYLHFFWIKGGVRQLFHLRQIFINFMLMLYGPKIGYIGQPWSIWCFLLIIAPMRSLWIILVTHVPSFMIF